MGTTVRAQAGPLPSLVRWSTVRIVHPAILVPAEFVGHGDARRGALDVVLRMHPSLWRDLQCVLPIQHLVVRPPPVALGFRRAMHRAAPLVELEMGGACVPQVFKRSNDGLRERSVRVALPLLPPVLHAPALEDAVVLEGVDPVLLFEDDLLEEIAPDILVVHAVFHKAIAHLKAPGQVLQDAERLLLRGTLLTHKDGYEEGQWDHEPQP